MTAGPCGEEPSASPACRTHVCALQPDCAVGNNLVSCISSQQFCDCMSISQRHCLHKSFFICCCDLHLDLQPRPRPPRPPPRPPTGLTVRARGWTSISTSTSTTTSTSTSKLIRGRCLRIDLHECQPCLGSQTGSIESANRISSAANRPNSPVCMA